MSSPVTFLTALAQAMSTMSLYEDGHPARERAVDRAHEGLMELQDEVPVPVFTFLGSEIVMGQRPIRELKSWEWGPRLAAVGIQRLEFMERVGREDFEAFLEEVLSRITGTVSSAEVRQGRPSNIRYGQVGLRGEESGLGAGAANLATATLGYSLQEEIEGVEWLHAEVKEGAGLQMLEAEGIVRSLSVAMHGDKEYLIPLLRIKEFDQYTVTHTLNVSVLTMALAEFLGLSPREVRAFGIAGLLHDLGKVAVPSDILNKPGKLTEEERIVINSHTVEGARLILETEEHLDMAAVVAYEHHIRIDGGGYPSLKYARPCHEASNLVHVCDVFDALRTKRPYRDAWPAERALKIIEEGAGPEFDKDVAHAFIQMMARWEGRIAEISTDDPEIRIGGDTPDAPAAPTPPQGPTDNTAKDAGPGTGPRDESRPPDTSEGEAPAGDASPPSGGSE